MRISMAGTGNRLAGRRQATALGVVMAGMLVLPVVVMAQSTTPPTAGVNPEFRKVWERTDLLVAQSRVQRSWVWGPSPIATKYEPLAEAAGGVRQVQYYDKGRMEINDPKADSSSPWYVTSGLLVYEMLSGRMQVGMNKFEQHDPATMPLAGGAPLTANVGSVVPTYATLAKLATLSGNENQAKPRIGETVDQTLAGDGTVGTQKQDNPASLTKYAYYEPTTGHNVPDVFWNFMNQKGPVYVNGQIVQAQLFNWVYITGYPLTEPYWITAYIDGKATPVMVQAFQRRLLTFTPSNAPEWRVEMGNAGLDYYHWRYGPQAPSGLQPAPVGDLGVRLTTQRVDLPAPFQTRQFSGVTDPLYATVTDQKDWEALWARIQPGMPQAGPVAFPAPAVDFSNAFVAAAFWGNQPNGCYALEIQGVYLKFSTLTVVVNQKGGANAATGTTGANCIQVITQPYDMVTVSRFNLTKGQYLVLFVDQTGKQIGSGQVTLP